MSQDNFQYEMWGAGVVESVRNDDLFMQAADDAMNGVAMMLYSNSIGAIQRLSTDAITVHNRFIRSFSDSLNTHGTLVRSSDTIESLVPYWRYVSFNGQPRFHRVDGTDVKEFVQCSGKRHHEHIVVSHIGPARVEFIDPGQAVNPQQQLLELEHFAPVVAVRSNIMLVTELQDQHLLLWACHPNGNYSLEDHFIHTDASELLLTKNIVEVGVTLDLNAQPQATETDFDIEEISEYGS